MALLIAIAAAPAGANPSASAPCAPLRFDGARYTACAFDARRDEIRLYWKDSAGKPYGGFDALAQTLGARGRALRFAMNAGMFETDLSPVGLFVEDGKRERQADTREGATNFHMKPNGILLDRRRRRGGHGDVALSRQSAPRPLRHPIRPDAGGRRPHPSQDPADGNLA